MTTIDIEKELLIAREREFYSEEHFLQSSSIKSIRFAFTEENRGTLEVIFHSNQPDTRYQVFDVDFDTFKSILESSSPGRAYWELIRQRNYNYLKLT